MQPLENGGVEEARVKDEVSIPASRDSPQVRLEQNKTVTSTCIINVIGRAKSCPSLQHCNFNGWNLLTQCHFQYDLTTYL